MKPRKNASGGFVYLPLLKELSEFWDAGVRLFLRQFIAEGRRSLLGFGWVVVAPMAGMVSWLFLRQGNLLQPGTTEVPYWAYIMLGMAIWGMFMGLFRAASGALMAHHSLLLFTRIPPVLLCMVQAAESLARSIVTLIIIGSIIAFSGVPVAWAWIFPGVIAMIPLILLAISLGIATASLSAILPDAGRVISAIMGFGFFTTPLVYARSAIQVPLFKLAVEKNPLTPLVCMVRDMWLLGQPLSFAGYGNALIVTALVTVFAFAFFSATGRLIRERLF
jgi:lipopolysaccharide transport system permease protein